MKNLLHCIRPKDKIALFLQIPLMVGEIKILGDEFRVELQQLIWQRGVLKSLFLKGPLQSAVASTTIFRGWKIGAMIGMHYKS